MQAKPETLIGETSDLLEEIIPVLSRNIKILQNDVNPQGGALQFLLQKEIDHQESLLQLTKELKEKVNRYLKPEPIHISPDLTAVPPAGDVTVIMSDGEEISYRRVFETFVEAIEKIGVERVNNLDLILNGIPLIATVKHPIYSQSKSDNYYITTHCNTNTKIDRLNEIKDRLNIDIKVIDNRGR